MAQQLRLMPIVPLPSELFQLCRALGVQTVGQQRHSSVDALTSLKLLGPPGFLHSAFRVLFFFSLFDGPSDSLTEHHVSVSESPALGLLPSLARRRGSQAQFPGSCAGPPPSSTLTPRSGEGKSARKGALPFGCLAPNWPPRSGYKNGFLLFISIFFKSSDF